MSWAKPMSSISSASSSTAKRTCERSMVPRARWSMTRPGVPTITWAPLSKASELPDDGLAAVDGDHGDACVGG